MRNIGYVAEVKPGLAEVLLGKHAQCAGCGACIAAADDRERRIEVSNEIGAARGAKVEIEISPGHLVWAGFLLFILPVVAALAGGYAGYLVAGLLGGPPTPAGIVVGSLAFAGSFLIIRRADKAGPRSGLPRIIRILDPDEPEGRC